MCHTTSAPPRQGRLGLNCSERGFHTLFTTTNVLFVSLAMTVLLPVLAGAQGYPPFYGPGWSVQCLSSGNSNGVAWNSQQAMTPPSGYVGGYSCNGFPRLTGISGTITPVLV